jgi:hypothetical protein
MIVQDRVLSGIFNSESRDNMRQKIDLVLNKHVDRVFSDAVQWAARVPGMEFSNQKHGHVRSLS